MRRQSVVSAANASTTTSGGASSVLSFSSRMADPWVICGTIASFDADRVGILLEVERELFRIGGLEFTLPSSFASEDIDFLGRESRV